jgi:nicotinamide-nucleotide adenylyltransferase
MTVGLYVGRFQPVHRGHVYAVNYVLERVDELIIGIGSAQFSHEPENPFTAGERFTMLRLALDEAGVDRRLYTIIPIPDTQVHSIWVAQVLAYTPSFNTVFTNDPLSRQLFMEAGFKVENIRFYKRAVYSATYVRDRILNGGNWGKLVPEAVARYIKQIGGVERIRNLAKTDKVKGVKEKGVH